MPKTIHLVVLSTQEKHMKRPIIVWQKGLRFLSANIEKMGKKKYTTQIPKRR